jgi:integrase/recombinase XerD
VATISPPPRRPIGDGGNGPAPTYAHAVEAFLIAHDRAGAWSAGTAVKYRQSLAILGSRLSEDPTGASVAALDTPAGAAALAAAFTAAFATLAPATRARHLAALRSALGWWRARGWLVTDPAAGWARPKIARDHSRALTPDQITALWRLDVGLREKTLWRLLYETAARATEILTLDIADLDRPGKRARAISKGGDTDWVYYQTGTALLLPRLLTGRTRGPVFLAERAPTRVTPTLDLCPDTGRARLSYRRAAELFAHATTPLATAAGQSTGWTLHQLRHSALTHDAESGTNTPMLLARSRHASMRSLERYARPGPEALARGPGRSEHPDTSSAALPSRPDRSTRRSSGQDG